MSINKNIKQCREKKNMSQELLAEKMDVSRQAVSKWESGESKPSTQNIMKLAKIFNISVNELIADFSIVDKANINKKIINWTKILTMLSLMLAFLPFAVVMIVYKFLPQTIPMHYNGVGEITRYGNKNELLILSGCLSLFVVALTITLSAIKNEKKEKIYYMITTILVALVFGVMQIFFSIMALNNSVTEPLNIFTIMQILSISINSLMIFFGIALPFTSPNFIFGLRITSTLSSEENWTKTHKLAGITIVLGGIIGVIFAMLINGYYALISFLFLIVGIVIPIVYSLKLDKRKNN